MARNEHLIKLAQLQKRHAEELEEARVAENPAIELEGADRAERQRFSNKVNAPYRRQQIESVNTKYKAALEALRNDFAEDSRRASTAGTGAIPAPPADTSQAWAKAKMLLDAGKSLHEVVRGADPAMLHAIGEWGPTYLQAEASKTREPGLAGLRDSPVDPKQLQRSLTNRWAEVVDGSDAEKIKAGLATEVDSAEFERTAQHLEAKVTGSNAGVSDMYAALDAHYAAESAAMDLGAQESQTETSKGDAA
jgi:hypothetical protein